MGLKTGACHCHFARRYLERNPQLPLSLRQIDPLIRQLSLSLLTSNRPEQYNIFCSRVKRSRARPH